MDHAGHQRRRKLRPGRAHHHLDRTAPHRLLAPRRRSAPACWDPSPPSPHSSLSVDQLARAGLHRVWLAYLCLSVVLGLGAAAAGWRAGKCAGRPVTGAARDRAVLVGLFGMAGALLGSPSTAGLPSDTPLAGRSQSAAPTGLGPRLLVNVAGCFVIGLSIGISWPARSREWHAAAGHRARRRPDHFQFLDHRHRPADERAALLRRSPQRRRQSCRPGGCGCGIALSGG